MRLFEYRTERNAKPTVKGPCHVPRWPRPNIVLRHYSILGRKLYPAEHTLGMELAQRIRPCRPGLWADLSSAQSSGSCSERLPDVLAPRLHFGELPIWEGGKGRARAFYGSFRQVHRLPESMAGPNLSGSARTPVPDPLALLLQT